jgi:hypothetical protein
MRKVLAITVSLMFAALILSPAMGYTIQTAGNQSYTVQAAGDQQYTAHSEAINYTASSGTPAHELTLESMPSNTVSGPAVQTTRVASSFKAGRTVPYTVTLGSGVQAVSEGEQVAKEPASLGEETTATETTMPAVETTVAEAAPVNETAAVEAPAAETAAPVEESKFSIMGTVFDDANGNGVMDDNETGLADWTVDLSEPAGTVLANATTSENGSYAFTDLLSGEYIVSQVVSMGWALIAPADGKYSVNLTADAAGLNFANQILPAPEPVVNETVEEVILPPENITISEQTVA